MYGASVRRRLYPLLQLVVRPHRARHFGTQTYAIQLAYLVRLLRRAAAGLQS
jgi:hypothetical protein